MHTLYTGLSRRSVLSATLAISALGGPLAARRSDAAASGRVTDMARLGWGFGGLSQIAKERGAFARLLEQDGIKVEWVGPFPNHAPSIQAVTGGSADFSFGGSTTPALAAIIAGSPLVFAQFGSIEPRTTAIIARDGSGIRKVTDLIGKTVAVNRSGVGEFLLVAALDKYHVPRSAVRIVYLNPPEAAPAFGSGQVDAWAMWSPGADIARSEFAAHDIFVDGRDLDFQVDFLSWLTTREFADQNPALIRAVNAAYAAEARWVLDHSAQAETIAQKSAGYSDQIRDNLIAQKRHFILQSVSDAEFIEQFQNAANWLFAHQVLPAQITVRDYIARL